MTFEDAAELGWHVQQLGLTPEALRAFELERIPRVGVIVQKAEVRLFWLRTACKQFVLCMRMQHLQAALVGHMIKA